MFAKVLLGYSGWLLGSCYAVAGVLLDYSVFWVITDVLTSGNNRKSNIVFKTDPVSVLLYYCISF